MDNYNKLPEEYEGLPIGIWMLKSDSSVALTLLENRILKIMLSYVTNGEKREIADMLTQRFGREGDKTSYEETHPLQDWITYWNLETWETEDVIFQIGKYLSCKHFDMSIVTRAFNIIAIGSLQLLILFVTALFFLGSFETFEELRADMPRSFLNRTLGGVVIGVVGCSIVAAGNLILDRRKFADKRVALLRIVLLTSTLSVLTSILGSALFFFHY